MFAPWSHIRIVKSNYYGLQKFLLREGFITKAYFSLMDDDDDGSSCNDTTSITAVNDGDDNTASCEIVMSFTRAVVWWPC